MASIFLFTELKKGKNGAAAKVGRIHTKTSSSSAAKQWKEKVKGRHLKKEEREEAAKVRLEEMEKLGKEVGLNKSIVSYLEMCVFTEHVNRGLNTLNYYRSRSKVSSQHPKITDIAAYNVLLQGFALKVWWC